MKNKPLIDIAQKILTNELRIKDDINWFIKDWIIRKNIILIPFLLIIFGLAYFAINFKVEGVILTSTNALFSNSTSSDLLNLDKTEGLFIKNKRLARSFSKLIRQPSAGITIKSSRLYLPL